MSMPHYLYGDVSLLNSIKGLEPNFVKHRSIVYYEPSTGIPMKANKRAQINTKLIRNINVEYETSGLITF